MSPSLYNLPSISIACHGTCVICGWLSSIHCWSTAFFFSAFSSKHLWVLSMINPRFFVSNPWFFSLCFSMLLFLMKSNVWSSDSPGFISATILVVLGQNLLQSQGVMPSNVGKHIITGWWFGTFLIFPYFWNNHPNWRSHIFQRGRYTTNQIKLLPWLGMVGIPAKHDDDLGESFFYDIEFSYMNIHISIPLNHCDSTLIFSGWYSTIAWNMNFMTFHILGMSSSQLDFHIFQRGRYTTNQIIIIDIYIYTSCMTHWSSVIIGLYTVFL